MITLTIDTAALRLANHTRARDDYQRVFTHVFIDGPDLVASDGFSLNTNEGAVTLWDESESRYKPFTGKLFIGSLPNIITAPAKAPTCTLTIPFMPVPLSSQPDIVALNDRIPESVNGTITIGDKLIAVTVLADGADNLRYPDYKRISPDWNNLELEPQPSEWMDLDIMAWAEAMKFSPAAKHGSQWSRSPRRVKGKWVWTHEAAGVNYRYLRASLNAGTEPGGERA